MGVVRDTPALLSGHPSETLDVIAQTLGFATADQRYAFETRYQHLNTEQLRTISKRLNERPFGFDAHAVFERALIEVQTPPKV